MEVTLADMSGSVLDAAPSPSRWVSSAADRELQRAPAHFSPGEALTID